jgi:hypothetical protein
MAGAVETPSGSDTSHQFHHNARWRDLVSLQDDGLSFLAATSAIGNEEDLHGRRGESSRLNSTAGRRTQAMPHFPLSFCVIFCFFHGLSICIDTMIVLQSCFSPISFSLILFS